MSFGQAIMEEMAFKGADMSDICSGADSTLSDECGIHYIAI